MVIAGLGRVSRGTPLTGNHRSWIDLQGRARNLSLRDPQGLVSRAIDALTRDGRIVVLGPVGTGRSRFAREIVAATGADLVTDPVTDRAHDPWDPALWRHFALQQCQRPTVFERRIAGVSHIDRTVRRLNAAGLAAIATNLIDRHHLEAVAGELLDAPQAKCELGAMVDLAAGRAGDLVEMMIASHHAGSLRYERSRWRIAGPLFLPDDVGDAQRRRHLLNARERHALDALAVAGALPVTLAARLVDVASVARLVEAGWLVVERGAGVTIVRFDRPADAVAVIADLPFDRFAALRRRIANLADDYDRRHPVRRCRQRIDGWHALVGLWRSEPATPRVIRRLPIIVDQVPSSIANAAVRVHRLEPMPSTAWPPPRGLDERSATVEAATAILASYYTPGVASLSEIDSYVEDRRVAAQRGLGATALQFIWTDTEAALAEAAGKRWVARDALASCARLAEQFAPPEVTADLASRRAVITAETGRLARAEQELFASRGLARGHPRSTARLGIVEALIASVQDLDRAVARAVHAAEQGFATDHRDVALRAVVMPARFGVGSDAAVALLASSGLAQRVPFAQLIERHLGLVDHGSAAELMDVAQRYLCAGRRLLAAETVAVAAGRESRAGAMRLERLATGLLASCPGAWTAAVAHIDPRTLALDELDWQIGKHVVAGATNEATASAVSISPRTVEARLTRIYRSLGVTSRHELAAMHAPLFQAGRNRSRAW